MKVSFPYETVEELEISDDFDARLFDLPSVKASKPGLGVVRQALAQLIGCGPLCELAKGKERALVISDDIHRPTLVSEFIGAVLEELYEAGLEDENIESMLEFGCFPIKNIKHLVDSGTIPPKVVAVHIMQVMKTKQDY